MAVSASRAISAVYVAEPLVWLCLRRYYSHSSYLQRKTTLFNDDIAALNVLSQLRYVACKNSPIRSVEFDIVSLELHGFHASSYFSSSSSSSSEQYMHPSRVFFASVQHSPVVAAALERHGWRLLVDHSRPESWPSSLGASPPLDGRPVVLLSAPQLKINGLSLDDAGTRSCSIPQSYIH